MAKRKTISNNSTLENGALEEKFGGPKNNMQDYGLTQFLTKTSYRGEKNFHKTTTNAITLPKLIESFENHLRGAGFVFEGHLDFVDDDGELVRKGVDDNKL